MSGTLHQVRFFVFVPIKTDCESVIINATITDFCSIPCLFVCSFLFFKHTPFCTYSRSACVHSSILPHCGLTLGFPSDI